MNLKKRSTVNSRGDTTLSLRSSLGLSSSGDDSSMLTSKNASSKRSRSGKMNNKHAESNYNLCSQELESQQEQKRNQQQRANSNNVKVVLTNLLNEITSFPNIHNKNEICIPQEINKNLRHTEKKMEREVVKNNVPERRSKTCSANCSTNSTHITRNSTNSVQYKSLKFAEKQKSKSHESEMLERWIAEDDENDDDNNKNSEKVTVRSGNTNSIIRHRSNNKYNTDQKITVEIADSYLKEMKERKEEQEGHELYSNYGLEAAEEFLSTPQSQHISQHHAICEVDKNIYDPLLSCTSSSPNRSNTASLFSSAQIFSPPPTAPRINCKDKINAINEFARLAHDTKAEESKQHCEFKYDENNFVFYCVNAKSIDNNDKANKNHIDSESKFSECTEEQGSTRCDKSLRLREVISPFARSTSFTPDETVRSLLAANPFTEPRQITLAEGVEMPSPQTPLWSELDATDTIKEQQQQEYEEEEEEEEEHEQPKQHVKNNNVLLKETVERGEYESCQRNEGHDARLSMLFDNTESFGSFDRCTIQEESGQNKSSNGDDNKVHERNCRGLNVERPHFNISDRYVSQEEKIESNLKEKDKHESEFVISMCIPSSHTNNTPHLETIFDKGSNNIVNYKINHNNGTGATVIDIYGTTEYLEKATNNALTINSSYGKKTHELCKAQHDNLFNEMYIGMESTANNNNNVNNTNSLPELKENNKYEHSIEELKTRETINYNYTTNNKEEEEKMLLLLSVEIKGTTNDNLSSQNFFSLTQEANEQELSKPMNFHLPRRSHNVNTKMEDKQEIVEEMANSSLVKRNESYFYFPSHQLDYSENNKFSDIKGNNRLPESVMNEAKSLDSIQIQESQPIMNKSIHDFVELKSNSTISSINSTILIKHEKRDNEHWAEETQKFFTYLDSRPLIVVTRTPEKLLEHAAADNNSNLMKTPRRSEFEKLIANVKGKVSNTQSHFRPFNVDSQGAGEEHDCYV